MYRWELIRAALAQRVIAVVRGESYDRATEVADMLLTAGLTTVEISLTTPFGLEVVGTLSREVGGEALVGAGAVLDGEGARAAVEAGASFLSCPGLSPDVIRTGHRYGVPVLPGVSTPTEVVRAMEEGADALKVFPAGSLGPGWIKDVLAEVPRAPLVAAGGVTVENAPEWAAAGAAALALDTALTGCDRDTAAKRVAELLGVLLHRPPGE
ncbi:bifunctional 4-hydroxy-2-oxoglutarate aldolase/2-dehydro-3-deoxy-phosphogluconate aldolase [Streptomyces sp. HB2AG]|uniref:bifunctional 4-hydroxy-2-oxoglutarate aldolase/2-dehydro-3-deoxy-phosphogluconate aldolase n=1 Tax=Streptomyces sp. HB2AG TaxID=2983400 RepID=UPI0022AAF9E4|nr:bifunctional 4-hydroxy-2-oxoglutarate aldolase/2-dehydro-3-deoxy-phosphogluconate aldolase [Streptomyces sp. HB2AG]MCZ2525601.1 bifunctional 4-hydroxy-2-oxoglutarate aldolase/2-dehydro-3-deoxy-phosphogluconate aldolase [Streptomyces sp. HB2AG]